MAQQWPTTAPSVGPGTHDPVATQAYMAGGGDYFRTGYYSTGVWSGAAFTSLTMNTNAMRAVPFMVPVRRAFDRIGLNVVTAASAGGVLRLGIYGTTSGAASTLILDAGTVDSTTTGGKEIVISQTLNPGLYYLAAVAQVASCVVTAHPGLLSSPHVNYLTNPPSSSFGFLYIVGGVSGAMPTPFGSSDHGSGLAAPVLALRAA